MAGNVIHALLRLGGDARGAVSALRDVEGAAGKAQKTLKGLQSAGDFLSKTVTPAVIGMGLAAGQAAVSFESSFAGVEKTVSGLRDSTGELTELGEELREGFRGLARDIPTAHGELLNIGEAAGQLGIKTENILDFTETMAMLAETTNLTAEEGASALARFANVTGMAQTDFDRLGSTIVELGNNFATTEKEIVEMAQRLAGAGTTIGMSETDILALAAAMSSLGIRAEAGGTAMSRVMVSISEAVTSGGEALAGFADVAGTTVSDFATMFETDPVSAIEVFVQGLGRIQEEGGNVFAVLENLELGEVRVRDALLRLANAEGVMTNALEMSNNAWAENTALQEEAETRFRTTASQLKLLRNRSVDIGIVLGEVLLPKFQAALDWALKVADGFAEMDEGAQNLIVRLGLVAAAAGPVLSIGTRLVTVIGNIVGALGTARAVLVDTGIAFKLLGEGASLAEVSSIGLAGKLAIIVPIAIAVAAAIAGIIKSIRTFTDETKRAEALSKGYAEAQARFGEEAVSFGEDTRDASVSVGELGAASALGAGQLADYAEMAANAGTQAITLGEAQYKAAKKAAEAAEKHAEAQEKLKNKLETIKFIISSPIKKANEEYIRQEEEILQTISDLQGELSEYERKNGMLVGSQQDLVIAQAQAEQAAGRLAEAQQNLAENTDPEKQLQLEAAVARAKQAVDGANQSVSQAGPHHANYRDQIDETKGKIEEWRGKLHELAESHRQTISDIILQILEAKLAQSGWSTEAIELYAGFAQAAGKMDEQTATAWRNVGEVVNSTHSTTAEKIEALVGITDRFVKDALGPEAEALLYASEGADRLAEKLDAADGAMEGASGKSQNLEGDIDRLGGVLETAAGRAGDLDGAVRNLPDHKKITIELNTTHTGRGGIPEEAWHTNSPIFTFQLALQNLAKFARRTQIPINVVGNAKDIMAEISSGARSMVQPTRTAIQLPAMQQQLAALGGGGSTTYDDRQFNLYGMDAPAIRILLEAIQERR